MNLARWMWKRTVLVLRHVGRTKCEDGTTEDRFMQWDRNTEAIIVAAVESYA